MTKYLAAALLTTALFTCTASAQTASNKTAAADSAADRAVIAQGRRMAGFQARRRQRLQRRQ